MADYSKFLSVMGHEIKKKTEKPGRLYFEVDNSSIKLIADYLFNTMGCRLSTAVAQEIFRGIEVTYHFSDDKTGNYYCPRVVMTNKHKPVMYSIAPVLIGAEWIEREMSEMFGIVFEGLPDPSPLLTGNTPADLKTPWIHRGNYERK
jgi:NADH-quinone oxidoreductase subunit C